MSTELADHNHWLEILLDCLQDIFRISNSFNKLIPCKMLLIRSLIYKILVIGVIKLWVEPIVLYFKSMHSTT